MERDFEKVLHGFDPTHVVKNDIPGQPAVGHDPTQELGTPAWQAALRMGLQVNARQRRN